MNDKSPPIFHRILHKASSLPTEIFSIFWPGCSGHLRLEPQQFQIFLMRPQDLQLNLYVFKEAFVTYIMNFPAINEMRWECQQNTINALAAGKRILTLRPHIKLDNGIGLIMSLICQKRLFSSRRLKSKFSRIVRATVINPIMAILECGQRRSVNTPI